MISVLGFVISPSIPSHGRFCASMASRAKVFDCCEAAMLTANAASLLPFTLYERFLVGNSLPGGSWRRLNRSLCASVNSKPLSSILGESLIHDQALQFHNVSLLSSDVGIVKGSAESGDRREEEKSLNRAAPYVKSIGLLFLSVITFLKCCWEICFGADRSPHPSNKVLSQN